MKKKHFIFNKLILILGIILLFSCNLSTTSSTDTERNDKPLTKLKKIEGLDDHISMISISKDTDEDLVDLHDLFIINNSEQLIKCDFIDENDEIMNFSFDWQFLYEVRNINIEYFIAILGQLDNSKNYPRIIQYAYLISKNTGLASPLNNDYLYNDSDEHSDYVGEEQIINGNNYLFLKVEKKHIYDQCLIRIDINDLNNMLYKEFDIEDEEVEGFAVNENGNLAYLGYNINTSQISLRILDSAFENVIQVYTNDFYSIWMDFDNNIYCLENLNIKTIDTDGLLNDYGTINYSSSIENISYIKNKGKILRLINWFDEFVISEIYNESNSPVSILSSTHSFPIDSFINVFASDDYLYLLGQDNAGDFQLIQIDPSDYSYKVINSDFSYEITHCNVENNESQDIIYFTGNNLTTNEKVIGLIDTEGDGTPVIIKENLNGSIKSFD